MVESKRRALDLLIANLCYALLLKSVRPSRGGVNFGVQLLFYARDSKSSELPKNSVY